MRKEILKLFSFLTILTFIGDARFKHMGGGGVTILRFFGG